MEIAPYVLFIVFVILLVGGLVAATGLSGLMDACLKNKKDNESKKVQELLEMQKMLEGK